MKWLKDLIRNWLFMEEFDSINFHLDRAQSLLESYVDLEMLRQEKAEMNEELLTASIEALVQNARETKEAIADLNTIVDNVRTKLVNFESANSDDLTDIHDKLDGISDQYKDIHDTVGGIGLLYQSQYETVTSGINALYGKTQDVWDAVKPLSPEDRLAKSIANNRKITEWTGNNPEFERTLADVLRDNAINQEA